jgi:hypothetical protein
MVPPLASLLDCVALRVEALISNGCHTLWQVQTASCFLMNAVTDAVRIHGLV